MNHHLNEKADARAEAHAGVKACAYFAAGVGGVTLLCQLALWIDSNNPLAALIFVLGMLAGQACVPAILALLGVALYARRWDGESTAGLLLSIAGAGGYVYWFRALAKGGLN